MILSISRDTNGNKTLRVRFHNGTKGFSVQTLGNLPRTYRMTKDTFHPVIAEKELREYIDLVGTDRQKELLGL